jgi:hypothetical protein
MSESRFLFRFRDLVAPTIEEHQRVITERGWCWWGWWKRPSEDSRSDIWDDIAQQTSAGQAVEVGLFDSGSGTVYRALVKGVIKPAQAGADNTIKVPQQEADHVPPYYRESPFSPAENNSHRAASNRLLQSVFVRRSAKVAELYRFNASPVREQKNCKCGRTSRNGYDDLADTTLLTG